MAVKIQFGTARLAVAFVALAGCALAAVASQIARGHPWFLRALYARWRSVEKVNPEFAGRPWESRTLMARTFSGARAGRLALTSLLAAWILAPIYAATFGKVIRDGEESEAMEEEAILA